MRFLLFLSLCFQSLHCSIAANDNKASEWMGITATESEDGAILVLGDSWASLSGDHMINICGPQTARPVQNDAQSGSTAADWASGEMAVKSMSKAKYEFDYVWLSIGGNDFLGSRCDLTITKQVADDIITTISHIVENSSNEKLKILYLGYSYPSQDICGDGMTAALFDEQSIIIRDAIKDSAYSEYVEVMDISDEFVTLSSSPLSDAKWYADAIHMNELGYLKLFSKVRIQRFFGCSGLIMPIINAGVAMSNWTLSQALGAAAGLLCCLIAMCCFCKTCRRNKNEMKTEVVRKIPKDGVVEEEDVECVLK